MDGFPLGMSLLPVDAAGPLLEFFRQMGMQRAVAVRPDGGRQRMVVCLGIVPDNLDLFLDKPVASGRNEPRAFAEILFAVAVFMMPAGVDDHHIVGADDMASRFFEIVIGDRLPHLFRQRDDDARTGSRPTPTLTSQRPSHR